ncbi:NAD(P)H-binding protein [Methylophilus sp. QUAN]|uniref:NAD(P)H-binding protein n=1 Tax=Methylophilus sp. QUAN TaxID=2781020 RepID=UPI00188E2F4E|nr:NAD(P)H-binding protein [Methylophilus sp. QUAN]MBF4990396.1 NAD(P)H-binding protein [Methylophilus sp. QUAN]
MRILQIGCGGLGTLIAQAALAQGHDLTIVRRSRKPVTPGAQALTLDVVRGVGVSALAAVPADILLYCLAPVEGQSYQQTYVEGLRHVLANVSMDSLKHVFFISSTGIYGEHHGEWIDDDTPAIPADAEGQVMLDAERLLDGLTCGHTALRVSGIYGPQRLYLLRLLQNQERWPRQTHWTNRMHEQDVAAAVVHLYQQVADGKALPGHCILTDGIPATQHEVLQWLAAQQQLPAPATPPLQPQSGKRIRNRFLQHTGFKPQFADYQAGYASILSSLK